METTRTQIECLKSKTVSRQEEPGLLEVWDGMCSR